MAGRKQKIGKWGENIAVSYLQDKGYKILNRNYSTRAGEIDIITQVYEDGETYLVFIEVKTRTTLTFGNPEDGVTGRKKDHILKAINIFLDENENLDLPWQIDVLAIQKLSPEKPPNIQHFENVFS